MFLQVLAVFVSGALLSSNLSFAVCSKNHNDFQKVKVSQSDRFPEADVQDRREGAVTINFDAEYLAYEPGDIIQVKKMGPLGLPEPHTAHYYSPTWFSAENSIIQITTHPRARSLYPTLSSSLDHAKPGDESFRVKTLKTGLYPKFFSGPVVMIAGGWAITRPVGIARYLEERKFSYPVIVVHSSHYGEKPFYSDMFQKLEDQLDLKYMIYRTDKNVPHLDEKFLSGEYFLCSIVEKLESYGDKTHYLVSGPDIRGDTQKSPFEEGISKVLEECGVKKSQIFKSEWNK